MKSYLILSLIFGILLSYTTLGSIPVAYAEEFSILINGERNPRIDKNYTYTVQLTNDPGEERLLEVFVQDVSFVKIYEWKFSKYDKELMSKVSLDMTDFNWDLSKTYKIVAKVGTTVNALEIQPEDWQVSNTSNSAQTIDPSIELVGMIETKLPQQFRVGFNICSGSKDLITPAITINTDLMSDTFEVMSNIGKGGCLFYESTIKANDPNSLKISFGNVVERDTTTDNLQAQVDSLKEEISSLKEQLKGKDAILMEQLKVIQQLASSFKKTFFDPVSTILGLT